MSDEVIEISETAQNEWLVVVKGTVTTRHRVRAAPSDIESLGQGRPAKVLIEESFRFLLAREPNTSILGSFDLLQIGRYFPEYETEIIRKMKQA